MDQSSLLHTLKELGLPEKAATVYLALLGKRRMAISDISRETGVKRATCYEHIDFLLSKDFIVRLPVGKRMLYAALEPRKILTAFKRKTANFEEKMTQMEQLHSAAVQKPSVIFYEGKSGIKSVYRELFKTLGEVRSIFPASSFFENFTSQDYNEFDKEISSHALKSRDLFVADKFYKRIKEIRERNGSDNKLDKKLPKGFTCNVAVLIYSDKVALISLRDLSATVIENKDIADIFRNMHDLMWKSIKS